tara:strand:- start:930 stop:1418 length:489 start_codon:yes stop_codon:yes gene_type:complete
MAKSVFKAGKEKADRRKKFVEEVNFTAAAEKGIAAAQNKFKPEPIPAEVKVSKTGKVMVDIDKPSVFKKGRAKAERRKEFTKEAKKAGKKAGNRRITKDVKEGGTLKRGRRTGQTAGKGAGDKSKAQLYKEAAAIKKAGKHKEAVSQYDKKQLQAFILKYGK